MIKRFGHAERGATAIEYALIAALVSIFIIAALEFTGNGMRATYNVLINAMTSVFGN
jgi:pilus assembly protein Flp/PilA